jgi:hypothetical protein
MALNLKQLKYEENTGHYETEVVYVERPCATKRYVA